MTNYVWRATDPLGNSVLCEMSANSARESEEILKAEGYTNLRLMENEVTEAAQAGFERSEMFGEEIQISAELRDRVRDKPRNTLFSALWEGIWQSKGFVVIILLVGAYLVYRQNYVAAALAGVALIAWMGFLLFISLPSILYRRLVKAGDWHRWNEVLDLAGKLETVGGLGFIKVPAPELGRWRAKALAGTGRLTEGLNGYQKFENQPGCPGWLHKAFVAGIYDLVKKHDIALEYNLKSIQEKPTATMYIDLANRYVRYKKDPAKARAALAEAAKEPLQELAKPFHTRILGILALLEGDYPAARKYLEEAIDMMEKTRHVPFRDGSISVAKAYLACVLAKQNELAAARVNYDQAKPYLVATDETELMRDCEFAIGRPTPV